jgi:hypothetical protein
MKTKYMLILICLLSIFLIGNVNALTNVNSCQVLSTQNEIYNLTSNVVNATTCFNVTAQNITIQCNNFNINSTTGSGIGINADNSTGSAFSISLDKCRINNYSNSITSIGTGIVDLSESIFGLGGNITLNNSILTGNVITRGGCGGTFGNKASPSGNLFIYNSNVSSVSSNSLGCGATGSSGGIILFINSTGNNLNSFGGGTGTGDASDGGNGGNVFVNYSNVNNISSYGGSGGSYGGSAGNVQVYNTNISSIYSYGGSGSNQQGGYGGNITINISNLNLGILQTYGGCSQYGCQTNGTLILRNVRFYNPYGSYTPLSTITSIKSFSGLNATQGVISLDSNRYPDFSIASILELYNTRTIFQKFPILNKNDNYCTTCTLNNNLASGNISFNVTSFSNYSLGSSYEYNSESYNLTTYETASETYLVNLNYSNSYYTSIAGTLYYNGTGYSGTRTGSGYNTIFTRSLTHSAIQGSTQNKSFLWQIGLTNSSGITYYNTSFVNQTIKNITFSLCGSSPINVPFLNFTFLDETTGLSINASNDLTDTDYWLGDGSVTKEYITSNTSANPSYAFCFNPADRTATIDMSFKYSNTGYPLRTFQYDNKVLTNTTTNKVLYLLGASGGIYSSIQTVTGIGNPISSSQITVERQFSGVWTIVEQGVTGSDGLVTFWLNPNYDHRITVVKSGYISSVTTIRPTQSLYSIILSTSSGNATFVQELEGIKWKIYPGSEILSPNTAYTFGFNVTAELNNLIACKFEVLNESGSILDTAIGCSSGGGNISLSFNTNGYSKIVRKFYLDTGDGYWIVDPIDNWISATNISSTGTIKSFFQDLATLDDELGGDDARSTFTRVVLFFFLAIILIGAVTYFTGVELSNPGWCIFMFWALISMASMGGWFTVTIFSTHTNSYSEWFNRMYIPGLLTLFMIAFYMNQWRRINN